MTGKGGVRLLLGSGAALILLQALLIDVASAVLIPSWESRRHYAINALVVCCLVVVAHAAVRFWRGARRRLRAAVVVVSLLLGGWFFAVWALVLLSQGVDYLCSDRVEHEQRLPGYGKTLLVVARTCFPDFSAESRTVYVRVDWLPTMRRIGSLPPYPSISQLRVDLPPDGDALRLSFTPSTGRWAPPPSDATMTYDLRTGESTSTYEQRPGPP